jgi:hypothetical protein
LCRDPFPKIAGTDIADVELVSNDEPHVMTAEFADRPLIRTEDRSLVDEFGTVGALCERLQLTVGRISAAVLQQRDGS